MNNSKKFRLMDQCKRSHAYWAVQSVCVWLYKSRFSCLWFQILDFPSPCHLCLIYYYPLFHWSLYMVGHIDPSIIICNIFNFASSDPILNQYILDIPTHKYASINCIDIVYWVLARSWASMYYHIGWYKMIFEYMIICPWQLIFSIPRAWQLVLLVIENQWLVIEPCFNFKLSNEKRKFSLQIIDIMAFPASMARPSRKYLLVIKIRISYRYVVCYYALHCTRAFVIYDILACASRSSRPPACSSCKSFEFFGLFAFTETHPRLSLRNSGTL